MIEVASQIIKEEVPLKPKLCLLHIYPEDFTPSNDVQRLLNICFLEAKRCLAKEWKTEASCVLAQWLKGMCFYFALERISYTTKGKLDKFWKIWYIFRDFLENNNIEVEGWNAVGI